MPPVQQAQTSTAPTVGATGTIPAHTQLKTRRRGNSPAPKNTARHGSAGLLQRDERVGKGVTVQTTAGSLPLVAHPVRCGGKQKLEWETQNLHTGVLHKSQRGRHHLAILTACHPTTALASPPTACAVCLVISAQPHALLNEFHDAARNMCSMHTRQPGMHACIHCNCPWTITTSCLLNC